MTVISGHAMSAINLFVLLLEVLLQQVRVVRVSVVLLHTLLLLLAIFFFFFFFFFFLIFFFCVMSPRDFCHYLFQGSWITYNL